MILYTMMPLELVYPSENEAFGKQKYITYQGIPMLVELTEQNSFQIIRILSSDPQHYLQDSCSPGSQISLTNVEGLFSF